MENSEFKVLIVDDEDDILEFVGYNLRKEGYQVLTASNGENALAIARKHLPHLILLDIMMPGMDGIETCKELREIDALEHSIITFFTARSEDYTQIAGFEAGGDDYITKPIKPRLLVSKVGALLRRYSPAVRPGTTYTIDDLVIDLEKYKVTFKGKDFILPKKEFELLTLLASRPDKVFTRDEIYARVWGDEVVVGERTIDVHIRKIRERLRTENIRTIKGVGYKYEQ